MSAQHTPGPWAARKYCGTEDNWFVRGPADERVCGQGSGRIREANARLIAAAPDLLEAAERARRHAMNIGITDGSYLAQLDAAIARARGDAA